MEQKRKWMTSARNKSGISKRGWGGGGEDVYLCVEKSTKKKITITQTPSLQNQSLNIFTYSLSPLFPC